MKGRKARHRAASRKVDVGEPEDGSAGAGGHWSPPCEVTVVGLIVNPIAGKGGRVGLKGTDGVLEDAMGLGADPMARQRAREFLRAFKRIDDAAPEKVVWLAVGAPMGADLLHEANIDHEVVFHPAREWQGEAPDPHLTTRDDTIGAARAMSERGAALIVFCGGDGTARDVLGAVGDTVPILGLPSGVKMYSSVFATSPVHCAEVVNEFAAGELEVVDGEVMDLDEDRYRAGEWNIELFGMARMPHEPTLIQAGKMLISSVKEDDVIGEITDTVREEMAATPGVLWILGPGGTIDRIARTLGLRNTLLGIDAALDGRTVATDLNEEGLLELLDEHTEARLLLSPIGANGFFLGRGNLPLSPEVVRRIGIGHIILVSTPAKLAATPVLHVDVPDPQLAREIADAGFFHVITRYRTRTMRRVEI